MQTTFEPSASASLVLLQPTFLPAVPSRTERLLREFLSGKKPTTIRAYARDFQDFAGFLGSPSVDAAMRSLLASSKGEATESVIAYREAMLGRGLAPATVNRRLAAIRSLIEMANQVELVSWTLKVKNLKTETYRDTRGPGRSGFARMVRELEGRTDTRALRDRAVLRLLYDCALRRAEVETLDLEHLDLAGDRVFPLRKGKSAREPRTIPPETKAALVAWLQLRGVDPGPLFTNGRKRSGRLTANGIYAMVRSLGVATGQRVTPHGLRHASITDALELTNGNLMSVAKFSGHAKLDTIRIYDDNRRDVAGDVARLVAAASRVN
jgi:integrase/recombinase XerC